MNARSGVSPSRSKPGGELPTRKDQQERVFELSSQSE